MRKWSATATPIFKRAALKTAFALGLLASVAGCVGVEGLEVGKGVIVTRDVVMGDGFRVVAPDGFCVDTTSQHTGAGRTFVALASCVNLGATSGAGPSVPALLSASVGPLPAEGFDRNARTEMGDKLRGSLKSSLARSGQVGDVTVHATEVSSAALYVNMSDASLSGLEPRFWRAFLPVGNKLVVLAAHSPLASPLGTEEGEDLIRDFAAGLVDANKNGSSLPARSASAARADAAASGLGMFGRVVSQLTASRE